MKSEGYWVSLCTGRWIEVRDHAMAVKAEPRRLGLTPSEVQDLSPLLPRDHDRLRLLAMRSSWLRVRSSTQGEVSAEFWCGTMTRAARALASFLHELGFGELTWVTLKNLKRRAGLESPLRRLLDTISGAVTFEVVAAYKRKLAAPAAGAPRPSARCRRRPRPVRRR